MSQKLLLLGLGKHTEIIRLENIRKFCKSIIYGDI